MSGTPQPNSTAGIDTDWGNINFWCIANCVPLSLASWAVCLHRTCDKPAIRRSLFCKHLTMTTQWARSDVTMLRKKGAAESYHAFRVSRSVVLYAVQRWLANNIYHNVPHLLLIHAIHYSRFFITLQRGGSLGDFLVRKKTKMLTLLSSP